MRARTTTAAVIAALALFYAAGCCETQKTATTTVVATGSSGPLLSDSVRCPSPSARKSLPPPRGEVRGELVYNLGSDMISNSNAVKLAGGLETPREMKVTGGVTGRCNPLPESYLQAVRTNSRVPENQRRSAVAPVIGSREAAPAPAFTSAPTFTPAPVNTVASAPADSMPWEPGVVAGGYCAPTICPAPTDTAIVCAPGTNLSDCFTLSETDLQRGPEVYVPGTPALAVPPVAPVTMPSDLKPPVTLPEPVSTNKSPAIAPTSSIPELVIPMEGSDKKYEVAIPPLETGAVQATPRSDSSASADGLPSVPQVTDMDRAIDAIMTRDAQGAAQAPEVQLPPSLN